MKKILSALSLLLCLCLLTGCAGTPVIYQANCTCPTLDSSSPAATETPTPAPALPAPAEGALKTGLALITSVKDSASAADAAPGKASYDVTMVAVLADDAGVIHSCIIDSLGTAISFDNAGQITTDLQASPQTKNELGDHYGMLKAGAVAEWDDQAAALAAFAVGKNVQELRSGAIDETGKAPAGTDLAASATIYLGGYVAAIEAAVSNALHLGAQTGDTLLMASETLLASSKSASAEENGNAQLDLTAAALTMKDGVITSCALDSVQAKVAFDADGTIQGELSATVPTKNQLGSQYNMVAWGGAIAEWNEQAASFAAYVTGKTPEEVSGIAVNEKGAPAGADLSTSVTISIGGFQGLIRKAAQ